MSAEFRSARYSPEKVAKRYVRFEDGAYYVDECEALPPGHWLAGIGAGPTIRSYRARPRDIPANVRKEAVQRHRARLRPRAVGWPLVNP